MAVKTRVELLTRANAIRTSVAGGAVTPETVGALLRDMIDSLVISGSGSPNGVVTGSPGDLYVSTGGGSGATLWVKESGAATNTGWVAK